MSQSGIHHITAIAGPPARNVDFYTNTLGMRLVKKTVNFDDPGTYHLYYGDETGQPGTILTFFPWEHAAPGRVGIGETEETSFRIPQSAVGYWTHRLLEKGVAATREERRFGDTALVFKDPDGMRVALVAVPGIESETGWSNGVVPAESAVRGVHGVDLLLEKAAPTGRILTDVLGFEEIGRDGTTTRYRAAGAPFGAIVDLHEAGQFLRGQSGRGSVHHIAFRADEAGQAAMAERLRSEHGIRPTEQLDRNYFRSVYFREPGGVLFEIATDDPGFAIDEPVATLGEALKLPNNYEPFRSEIEATLPAIA
ncbi:ring-cleaving dioxygenase [Acuticoccus sp. M5D2P5]|uniref:ring-cleaving dioxygenase n=1 Tax=Acuticoccus kalidii TaxID=2910977 RepID=UPI001F16D968|nr:ring-cleaving dioxygenase [Acuticoccus kalidii]MCF3936271.1 ring-cleaving dioxygenase [Acuticoccus kalidii]